MTPILIFDHNPFGPIINGPGLYYYNVFTGKGELMVTSVELKVTGGEEGNQF